MGNLSFNRVAAVVFAVVAVGHLYRAVSGLPFQFGSVAVPIWVSCAGALVAGLLSVWGFRSRG
jgi:hypothetical protein